MKWLLLTRDLEPLDWIVGGGGVVIAAALCWLIGGIALDVARYQRGLRRLADEERRRKDGGQGLPPST